MQLSKLFLPLAAVILAPLAQAQSTTVTVNGSQGPCSKA